MSTAFQNAVTKNAWRDAVQLLLEQTSKEHIAHGSWTRIQAKERLPELLAQHGPDTRGSTQPAYQGSGSQRKHLCLVRTLANTSKTCLGPREEVEITPERGRGSRDKERGWLEGDRVWKRTIWKLEEQHAARKQLHWQGYLSQPGLLRMALFMAGHRDS